MIDFSNIAAFAELDLLESEQQIDQLEARTRDRWPAEAIQQRRNRLPLKRDAVRIVRIVADDEAIRELVAQQMGAGA